MSLVIKNTTADSIRSTTALTDEDIRHFAEPLRRTYRGENGRTVIADAPLRTNRFATVLIDQTPVHLLDDREALEAINGSERSSRPLAVASINLDHIHHFHGSATQRSTAGREGVEWLNLIDGAPIASQVERMTSRRYPKLSGSDLIGPILDDAARQGKSIAIVGGSPELATRLKERFAAEWPGARYAGQWAPSRDTLADPSAARALARELRAADIDIVLVCLGKPRQEDWIASFGAETGAGVLLAFGAVVDFLAGHVSRAPRWISNAGLEWAWRLLLEPKRLAKRYLVQGPPAYMAVRRSTMATA